MTLGSLSVSSVCLCSLSLQPVRVPPLHLQRLPRLLLTELPHSSSAGQFTARSHDPRVQALGSQLGSRSNGSEGRGEGGREGGEGGVGGG